MYFKIKIFLLFLLSFVILVLIPKQDDTPKVQAQAQTEPTLSMKNIFEERNQHFNQQCRQVGKSNQFPKTLFGLKERALAWCPVPKSGTSTWITYLMELSSKSTSEKTMLYQHNKPVGFGLAGKIAPELSRKSWNKWLTSLELTHQKPVKFIVVRNPFDRLVSAFRDRIERECSQEIWGGYSFKKKSKEIVRKYRPKFISEFGPDALSKAKNYGAIGNVQL